MVSLPESLLPIKGCTLEQGMEAKGGFQLKEERRGREGIWHRVPEAAPKGEWGEGDWLLEGKVVFKPSFGQLPGEKPSN